MARFAFIMHPLSVADVARKYPAAALIPGPITECLLTLMRPRPVSEITGVRSLTGATTQGWFVGLYMTAHQLKTGNPSKATKRIIEAGKVAQDLGAEIVGLGAFTSVVGDAGYSVAEALDIGVTTGNSYTVATALQGSIEAAGLLEHEPAQCTAAILGATGSIGRVAAKILGPQVREIVLNARAREPLEELAAELAAEGVNVRVETDVATALRDAEITIAVTSAVEAVVQPEMLRPGSVVCDVARPRDVSRHVAEKRPDVLVIEGGAVAVPGNVEFNLNFGFPPGLSYACMAETMILALEGRCEDYSLGRDISIEQVQEIAGLAVKHGFKLAGFRSFERKVSQEYIDRVRAAAEANR
ncbi:MAG: shikimate dehydrogenase [Acidobacteriota bacterium]|nr:shikimate dehydrogenase [Acidobacteriota bacterium]